MKWILFLSVTAASQTFAASIPTTTRVLVDYEMGNQITRTSIVILSSGLIIRKEINMGVATYIADMSLTKSQVKELAENIDLASSADQIRRDDVQALEGGSFGRALGFTSDGSVTDLYDLALGTEAMKKTLVCQSGKNANIVINLIQNMARDKMPLDSSPCR